MKKVTMIFFVILSSIVLLVACQSNETKTEVGSETKEEKLNKKIKVDKKLEFEQFNIEFESAKAYEKDNKLLLDIKFSWRNKRLPDGSTLFVATLFDVVQADEELKEINDHWNPNGDRSLSNDVFLNNTSGGLSSVKLTYMLDNKNDPIELIFTPTTETEESQKIKIELN